MSRFRWIWETEVNNEQIGKNGARIVTSLGIRLTGCTVQTDMCLTTLPQWLSNLDSPVIHLNTEGIHGWHVSTFLYFQKAVWFLFIVFVYFSAINFIEQLTCWSTDDHKMVDFQLMLLLCCTALYQAHLCGICNQFSLFCIGYNYYRF